MNKIYMRSYQRFFYLSLVCLLSLILLNRYAFALDYEYGSKATEDIFSNDYDYCEQDSMQQEMIRSKENGEWKERKRLKKQEKRGKLRRKRQNKIKKEEYGEYTLGKDDVIDINIRRHPEFSGRFPIGPNGKIQYPFVGDLELACLTKTEAKEFITDVLSQYIESPEVDITIVEYNSKVVYVFGQVARPGKYSMQAEFMPLREAVLAAGLPRENIASLRRAVIIRPLESGKTVVKKVNLLSLFYNGNLKLNYDLKSGDIVYLPSTVLYKVSTILDQVISPIFRGAMVYETYDDIRDDTE